MTKPKSATSPPVLVLYGLDAEGRHAPCFQCRSGRPRQEGAQSLELQVLRIETVDQIELARQLPSGEILAPGRGHVPVVRKEQFDKLLALVPAPNSGPSQEAVSTCGGRWPPSVESYSSEFYFFPDGHLHRLFLHQPKVMLCVLVIVLNFGCIAGRCGGTRERHIAFVAPFGVGKLNTCRSAKFPFCPF